MVICLQKGQINVDLDAVGFPSDPLIAVTKFVVSVDARVVKFAAIDESHVNVVL